MPRLTPHGFKGTIVYHCHPLTISWLLRVEFLESNKDLRWKRVLCPDLPPKVEGVWVVVDVLVFWWVVLHDAIVRIPKQVLHLAHLRPSRGGNRSVAGNVDRDMFPTLAIAGDHVGRGGAGKAYLKRPVAPIGFVAAHGAERYPLLLWYFEHGLFPLFSIVSQYIGVVIIAPKNDLDIVASIAMIAKPIEKPFPCFIAG